MSRVGIHEITKRGVVRADMEMDVENSHRFYIAVWQEMSRIHGKKNEEELWASVVKLPRADALIVAATLDRCWFPSHMAKEVSKAMKGEMRFSSNLAEIAQVLDGIDTKTRGFGFSTSLSNTWACNANDHGDELHHMSKDGHSCTLCGAKLQNAEHLLSGMACCAEDP